MTPRLLLAHAVAAPAIALAASSADTSPATPDETHTFSVSIAPGEIHEECVKLAKLETRRYEWSSDSAIDFNIHYHEGNEVFYPVKHAGVRQAKGTFRAKRRQDFCWMWTAKTPAKLEGKIEK